MPAGQMVWFLLIRKSVERLDYDAPDMLLAKMLMLSGPAYDRSPNGNAHAVEMCRDSKAHQQPSWALVLLSHFVQAPDKALVSQSTTASQLSAEHGISSGPTRCQVLKPAMTVCTCAPPTTSDM